MVLHHEPWLDEAQAWLMAKNMSWRDLLFQNINEGHPRLWHLLLKILITLKLPYNAMNVFHFLIAFLVVYIIYRYGPWERYIKILIIFNYYFAYEYNIVARSYVLIGLLLFLYALTWKNRHKHPMITAIFLGLMCETHLFSLIIAFILAIIYLYDLRKRKINLTLKYMFSGLLLILLAIHSLMLIIPKSYTPFNGNVGLLQNIKYVPLNFFLIPELQLSTRVYFSKIISNFNVSKSIYYCFMNYLPLLTSTILFLGFILSVIRKLNDLFKVAFLYIIMVIFFTFVYGGTEWHAGVIFVFIVYLWWEKEKASNESGSSVTTFSKKYKIVKVISIIFLLTSILNTGYNFVCDIRYKSSGSKQAAIALNSYIKDKNFNGNVLLTNDLSTVSVIPYLQKIQNIYFPGYGDFSYMKFDAMIPIIKTAKDNNSSYLKQLNEYVKLNSNKNIFFIDKEFKDSENTFLKGSSWEKIYKFSGDSRFIRGYDSFNLYKYTGAR